MTLTQINYALTLQRAGSFRRAASTLGISQPGLSLQIRKLEEELDIQLFDRSQRQLRVTVAGKVFLEHAELLLTRARQLRDLAATLREEFSGRLTIGIIPTLAPYLLPLFIEQLNQRYPKLKIHVQEAITEEVLQGIRTGALDIGLVATPIQSKTIFSTHPLFYERFLLFVSHEHTLYSRDQVDISEVPLQDLWLLKEGNCLRNQVDNICDLKQQGAQAQNLFYFESHSIESLCRIVEYKGGVTVLPELTTLHFDSEREDMIKALAGPRRVREISLLHLPNHVRSPLLQEIGELIRHSVPKKMWEKGEVVETGVG